MWDLVHKEDWALKNWYFHTVVLEKTLESPLDSKEIQAIHLKQNQSWIFIGRIDAEAKAAILWWPDAESTHWKRPWCWERLRQEEKGMTEDEVVRWHHSQWAWVWTSSRRWWRTGKPGILQSMGMQKLNTTEWLNLPAVSIYLLYIFH